MTFASPFLSSRGNDALWKKAQAGEDGDSQAQEAPSPQSPQEEGVVTGAAL
jgi:hypothetical protein